MSHKICLYFYSYVKAGVTRETCSNEGILKISQIMFGDVSMDDFPRFYICVYEFDANVEDIGLFLESLFERFNTDENPLADPKYREKIKEWLSHTSMSVGDVIQIDEDYYVVKGLGFEKL